jgi:hypothetical protein
MNMQSQTLRSRYAAYKATFTDSFLSNALLKFSSAVNRPGISFAVKLLKDGIPQRQP